MSEDKKEKGIVALTNFKAVEVFKAGSTEKFLDTIKAVATEFVSDVSTKEGRDELAAMGKKISLTKNKGDEHGKNLVKAWKDDAKVVDTERKKWRDSLEYLQAEVLLPLTEWQGKEQARKEIIAAKVEEVHACGIWEDELTSDQLRDRLTKLAGMDIDESFEEYQEFGRQRKNEAIGILTQAIEKRDAYEAEQAELERLRKEAADREQKEREDKIAQEAKEKAEKEAAEKAEIERKRVEKEKQDIIDREKAAKLEAKQAEERRVEAEKKAALDRKNAAKEAEERRIAADAKAKRDAKEAKERAETAAKGAQERAKREQQEAIDNERKRVEAEKRQEAEALAKREANKKLVAAAWKKAKLTIMELGADEDLAKKIVIAISKGEIPAVSITY